MGRHPSPQAMLLLILFAVATAPAARAQSRAYRFTDLDLRDPHLFTSFLGCRDITDTPLGGYSFNTDLQSRIQNDGDSSGALDLNLLLVFDPFDSSGVGGMLRFGHSNCTAPLASTACGPPEGLSHLTYVNGSSGQCLAPLVSTTHGYAPAVTTSSAPCFVTDPAPLTLQLGGIPFALSSARISGTYSAAAGTPIVNGLLSGFLSRSNADATTVPASYALIGGQPLSQLLPGGDPPGTGNTNCAAFSDLDLGPDGVTPGWWMYFNFAASSVPYVGGQLDVPEGGPRAPSLLVTPNPSGGVVSFECPVAAAGRVRVSVYDVFGRRVRDVVDGVLPAGTARCTWDGRDASGALSPPGLYLVRLSAGGQTMFRRFVRLHSR